MEGPTDSDGPASARVSGYSVWTEALGDIDALVLDHQNKAPAEYTGITKDHWTPSTGQPRCMNPSCKKTFSLTERHHHCRRCGGVFCKPCTSYRRRLNILSHPDPGGKPYKVCHACYDDPQTLGQARTLMPDFESAKWAIHQGLDPHPGTTQVDGCQRPPRPGLRSRLDAMLSCDRLVSGFRESLTSTKLQRAAEGLKGLIQRPTWKLHPNNVYERLVPQCRRCLAQFGLLLKRHYCTACGAAICWSCSTLDLIVFVPNDGDKTTAKWAIIKIVGCPEKEPDLCMYLRVCEPCRTRLAEIQAHHVHQTHADTHVYHAWQRIEKLFTSLCETQRKIDTQLPKYQELIDSLEISPGSAKSLPQSQSNTQILAKAQGDLSDHFTQFVMTIHGVRSHRPPTKGQSALIRNLIKSKIQFYQENIFTFRELKRRLEAITPLEVLTMIQDIVDTNAINSCYLSVKQLILEVLHLSIKHKLPDTMTLVLTPLEQIALEDLEVAVTRSRENWDDHLECVNKLLQLQLKHHRLIRVSTEASPGQAEEEVRRRVLHCLQQVQLQMAAKCADRSFPRTKTALQDTRETVQHAT